MEKLQAALSKARRARGDAASDPRPSVAPGRDRQSGRWDALDTFQVPDSKLQAHRVVTREANPDATPFDILRTKILLQMRQNNWKRLAITSPMPHCGKSTIACNLALGLGRQRELRSILMDFDLRSPSVAEFFDVTPPHNISALLTGQVSFEEQALRFGDNVAVSMTQLGETDPTRLLLAEETSDILGEIEEAYQPDIMIFDMPSVLVNDETRAFLKNADCALIVARANTTRYRHFDVCEREVAEHTNLVGTVLNAYSHGDPHQSG